MGSGKPGSGDRPNPERVRPRKLRMLRLRLNGKQYSVSIAGARTTVYRDIKNKGKSTSTLRRVRDWAETRAVLAEAQRKMK